MSLTRVESFMMDFNSPGGFTVDEQSGAASFKVDAVNRKIGIGTSSPDKKLHVYSDEGTVARFESTDSDSALIRFKNATADNVYIGIKDADFFVRAGASERLRVTSDGFVGIGNTSPEIQSSAARNLVIGTPGSGGQNGLTICSNTSGTNNIYFADASSGQGESNGRIVYSHVDDSLRLHTTIQERLRITSTGNVGIGTNSPSSMLEVSGATPQIKSTDTDVANSYSVFQNSSGISVYNAVNNGAAGQHLFQLNGSEVVRIASNGRVGIGTSSPSYELDVSKTKDDGSVVIRAGNNSDTGNVQSILQLRVGTTSTKYVNFNVNYAASYLHISGANVPTLYNSFDTQIFRKSDGTEKLRFDSDGRVLMNGGTATNSWAGGDDIIIGNTTSGTRSGITLISNANTDGGIYWSHGTGTDAYAGQIAYNHGNGKMSFYTEAAARLTIGSTGNVGIGSASPTTKLDVNGAATFAGDVQSGGNPYGGSPSPGARLDSGGALVVARASADVFTGKDTNTGGTTSSISYSGAATFSTTVNAAQFYATVTGDYAFRANSRGGYYVDGSDNEYLYVRDGSGSQPTISLNGNDGSASFADGDLVISANGAISAGGSYGTTGQVLTSNGSGSAATWTTISGGGGGGSSVWTTNGSDVYRASGSVGLGVTTPNFTSFGSNTGGIEISDVNTNNALLVQSSSNEFYFANTSATNYIWGQDDAPIVVGTDNTEKLRITSNGIVQLATDAVDFANGTGYITTKGSGDLVIRTTNSYTERLRVANGGDVGIGTTPNDHNSFSRALDINGSLGAAVYLRTNGSTSDAFIVGNYGADAYFNNRAATGNTMFFTNGAETLRINATGNVGIGTTNPSSKLYVSDTSGAVVINRETDSVNQINFRTLDTHRGSIGANSGACFTVYDSSSTERLRINNSGQVLIGTSTNNAHDRLTIHDPGDSFISIRSDAAADNRTQALDFGIGTADRSSTNLTGVIQAVIHSQAGGTLKSDLRFSTNSGDSISEKVRIDSSGNLQVSSGQLTVGTTGSTGLQLINDGTFGTIQSAPLKFRTAATERLHITSDGKIGVAVTPSAWHSSSANTAMQIKNGVLFDYAGAQFDVGKNYYYDGTNYKYIAATYPPQRTAMFDGHFIFNTAAAGTADTAFAWIERMRLDNNGRLLINTSDTTNAQTYADDLVIGSVAGDNGITVVAGTSGSGSLAFSDGSGNNSKRGLVQYNHFNNDLYFYTNGSEKVRITSEGYLGVGNSDPKLELQVGESGGFHWNSNETLFVNNVYYDSGNKAIKAGYAHRVDLSNLSGYIRFLGTAGSATAADDPITLNEFARFSSTGNFGIGANNPTNKLTVNGSAVISANGAENYNQYATLIVGERGHNDGVASIQLHHALNTMSSKIDGRDGVFAVWADWNSQNLDRIKVDGTTATEIIDLKPGGVSVISAHYDTGNSVGYANVAGDITMTGGILSVKNDGHQSELRLYCESNNAHYASLKAPLHANFSGNVVFTLPATAGVSGQVLSTDGSGTMSWVDQSAGGGGGGASDLDGLSDAATWNSGQGMGIGSDAGRLKGGSKAMAVGFQAMYTNQYGNYVTAIGYRAGYSTTGSSNTFLGYRCGDALTTGQNNIIIGKDADASSATVSNEITLGDSSITALRCAVTSITSLSDSRDKKDIEDIDAGLDFIKAVRPVKFEWDLRERIDVMDDNDNKIGEEQPRAGLKEYGFVAQELDAVETQFGTEAYSRLVSHNNPDKLEADTYRLFPILVKAVQELAAENAAMRARLDALEGA